MKFKLKFINRKIIFSEMESSSDDDDLDDSDDPDKESIEPITVNRIDILIFKYIFIQTSINTKPIPSEQVKTGQ